jgi:hypothetical protein
LLGICTSAAYRPRRRHFTDWSTRCATLSAGWRSSIRLSIHSRSCAAARRDYRWSPGRTLRASGLSLSAIDWVQGNFFKTSLELGHCLRLPEEGPCECDLYPTCARLITTPEYAPRLRSRRRLELELAEDAAGRGWTREVERHGGTAHRIDQLPRELHEPFEGAVAAS